MTDFVTNASKAVTTAANQVVNSTKNAANNAFQMIAPASNSKKANNTLSVMPFGNSPKAASNVPAAVTNTVNAVNNSLSSVGSMMPSTGSLTMFAGLLVIFIVLFSIFSTQIKESLDYISRSIRKALGIATDPEYVVTDSDQPIVTPVPPQDNAIDTLEEKIAEKLLPTKSDSKEVFNVAQNKFTFYDAEPLCRALGAELATYDQVKEAWNRGADWCNYGWVKGQMAVYPTQQETYDKLQSGPAEQAGACGTTGLNGGFFENPDLRFGVNCFGKKPPQSAYDEKLLMQEGKIPMSPDDLKVDALEREFKKQAGSLFVKPFSDAKWSTA